jgi:hypothetical protein
LAFLFQIIEGETMQLHDKLEAGKNNIITNGIKHNDIPNVYTFENYGFKEALEKSALIEQSQKSYSYPQEEIFGNFCTVCEYIKCPVDMAFEYSSNIYSLEEWTFSLRDLKHVGGGLYKGLDNLTKDTFIYIRAEVHPETRVVDFPCAWDQGEELWMRYHYRFLDAMPTLRKPGTVMLWTNCKHPYYDRQGNNIPNYIAEGQQRNDRKWVGDFWLSFYAGHLLETKNLKNILEYRFANA